MCSALLPRCRPPITLALYHKLNLTSRETHRSQLAFRVAHTIHKAQNTSTHDSCQTRLNHRNIRCWPSCQHTSGLGRRQSARHISSTATSDPGTPARHISGLGRRHSCQTRLIHRNLRYRHSCQTHFRPRTPTPRNCPSCLWASVFVLHEKRTSARRASGSPQAARSRWHTSASSYRTGLAPADRRTCCA